MSFNIPLTDRFTVTGGYHIVSVSFILIIQFLKGILKLILVIFCISWKLAIGSINDIHETLTQFLSMKVCKSDMIRWWFCHIFLFSLGFSNNWIFASWTKIHFDPFKWYYGCAKYFCIVFTIKLKRNNLRHKLKKYMLKWALNIPLMSYKTW